MTNRHDIFRYLTQSVPPWQILPLWARLIKAVLFPLEMLGWVLTRPNHYDILSNTYVIYGVRYRAEDFRRLSTAAHARFSFINDRGIKKAVLLNYQEEPRQSNG